MAQIAQATRGKPIEIWFSDEARVGQKNTITRRWARRGTRPSAPKDQRTACAYIRHPEPVEGRGDLPGQRHRGGTGHAPVHHRGDEPASGRDRTVVAPGAHPVLLLDQAGWHTTRKLVMPANITPLPLPARAPELNPVENLWQLLRDNWLVNRVFTSYADILDHCCHAWRRLIDQPWRIMSIGLRPGDHRC